MSDKVFVKKGRMEKNAFFVRTKAFSLYTIQRVSKVICAVMCRLDNYI